MTALSRTFGAPGSAQRVPYNFLQAAVPHCSNCLLDFHALGTPFQDIVYVRPEGATSGIVVVHER
jgi:hypothetical protein